ncbi:hypothetical protein [Marinobacter shengliensis]|uniref:hypothetical protein n=1 Tax=Marinobacter shengliensis TaxID=1389223 RepID=UPI0035BA15ED
MSADKKAESLEEMRLVLLERSPEVYAEPLPGPREDFLVQKEIEAIAEPRVAATAGALVRMWLTEKDSFYLDWALTYCRQRKVGPTKTTWELATKLAELRYYGKDQPARRLAILKEHAKQSMMFLMINLIYSGGKLEAAASSAAMIFKTLYPHLKPYKASSLEQIYSEQIRRTGIEEEYFRIYRESGVGKDFQESFERVRKIVPEVDTELKGERR